MRKHLHARQMRGQPEVPAWRHVLVRGGLMSNGQQQKFEERQSFEATVHAFEKKVPTHQILAVESVPPLAKVSGEPGLPCWWHKIPYW